MSPNITMYIGPCNTKYINQDKYKKQNRQPFDSLFLFHIKYF